MLRVVYRDERLVVSRRGRERRRVRRVPGPGLVVIPSVVGRLSWVTPEPPDLALVAHATTTDQVPRTVLATARCRIVARSEHVTARTRQQGVEVDSLQTIGVATQVFATLLDAARQRR